MTLVDTDYTTENDIVFESKASKSIGAASAEDVCRVVAGANMYLATLHRHFCELNFDVFEALGQRNISGFIGEIFSSFFARSIDPYVSNPHPDGRPDILYLASDEAAQYFYRECFRDTDEGERAPTRSNLAPFLYGGLEVKSTIGNSCSRHKEMLMADLGINGFAIGVPRIRYLRSLTYWGHHRSCENLLGLYYDYCAATDGIPQIIAVFHAVLIPTEDWAPVSTGKANSKKTSNTALTACGRQKILDNPIVVLDNIEYRAKLKEIGVKLQ